MASQVRTTNTATLTPEPASYKVDDLIIELAPRRVRRADAVILVTDHDAFDYDLVTAHAALVLDTRRRLDGPNVEQL